MRKIEGMIKSMRHNRIWSLCIILINIIGVVCLVCFAVPCVGHDTRIVNPNAMLPAEAWDWAGMALTFGLIPLLAANGLSFFFVQVRRKQLKFLFFIPSAVCLVIVYYYWNLAMAMG